MKGSLFQEHITVLNVYVPGNRASNHMRQKLIESQGEIDEFTLTVGDFNTSLSEMDRSRKPGISKGIVKFSNNVNQLDIMDIYRQCHPTVEE